MSDGDLVVVRLDGRLLPDTARWADGLVVRLPAGLATHVAEGAIRANAPEARARAQTAAISLRERAAYLHSPPRISRLPINYRNFPGPIRRLVANCIGRIQRGRQASWARFPGWPVDLSADLAADLAGHAVAETTHQGRTPVLLTHDIDSHEGLENLVSLFLPIEERFGARSANYIVPFAWPLDHGLIAEAATRGHEIGIHGYDHSNRTSFCSPEERIRRIRQGAEFGKRYDSAGYRAPSLVRSRELLNDLIGQYDYDSSIPTSGGPFPVPNNGCASARPWLIKADHGSLWELPLSLPRDGSLRFLGHSADEIMNLWLECAHQIAAARGIVVLLTHCERGFSGNPTMLGAYTKFLEKMATSPGFEFIRPRDLVARLKVSP